MWNVLVKLSKKQKMNTGTDYCLIYCYTYVSINVYKNIYKY